VLQGRKQAEKKLEDALIRELDDKATAIQSVVRGRRARYLTLTLSITLLQASIMPEWHPHMCVDRVVLQQGRRGEDGRTHGTADGRAATSLQPV